MTPPTFKEAVEEITSILKVPCDCPKGGRDSEGLTCHKCDGSEWVLPPKTAQAIESLLDLIEKEISDFFVSLGEDDKIEAWKKYLNGGDQS